MFSNKFIQNNGENCFFVCLANLLNNQNIISNENHFTDLIGIDALKSKKYLEKHSFNQLTFVPILFNYFNNISCPDIFYTANYFKESLLDNENNFFVYFALIKPSSFDSFHSILIIKNVLDDSNIYILDPIQKNNISIPIENFFLTYDCYGIQLVVKKNLDIITFNEIFLNHLIINQNEKSNTIELNTKRVY